MELAPDENFLDNCEVNSGIAALAQSVIAELERGVSSGQLF
jgi:hypothetical protein